MAAKDARSYLQDPKLSLSEKWRRHREHKKKKNNSYVDPIFLNMWGPWTILFLLCGAGGWGTAVAMPTLYAGSWEGWLVIGHALVALMVLEVAINWSLTRWVGSEYIPSVHGTKPSEDAVETSSTSDAEGGSEKNGTTLTQRKPGQHDNGVSAREKRDFSGNEGSDKTNPSPTSDTSKKRPANGHHNGFSFTMYVASALPTEDGKVERKPYPYWSWVPCLMCQRLRPPRCHHCTLCQQCLLKRDHHCYMTGACIGVNNQRFFIVFLLWSLLLCVFGTFHMLPYTYYHVTVDYNISVVDFLPPVCLIRGLLGYVSLVVFLLSVLFWMLLVFTWFAFTMLNGALTLLVKGQTTFEFENGIKVADTRSLLGKLRSVFGEYWWLNIFIPTYPWIRPEEDAVSWPHIKPC